MDISLPPSIVAIDVLTVLSSIVLNGAKRVVSLLGMSILVHIHLPLNGNACIDNVKFSSQIL